MISKQWKTNTQWQSAISQKSKDLSCTALKAWQTCINQNYNKSSQSTTIHSII